MSASPLFHPLRVRRIEPDTAEAVIVSFDIPAELRSTFGFTQGQYLTLRATIAGQDLRRSYSICAGVDDGELRVGVRRVKDGVFSNWIHAQLKPGDVVQVMAPQGRFYVPIEPTAHRHFVGIAGGSGITPILSIMKTVLAREPHSRFTLIYGNRTLQSTMFKEELEDLKNRHLARLTLHHVFSDEETDVPLNHGLMNRDKLAEFLGSVLPAAGIAHAFVCGPYQMNDEAEAALLDAGVPAERIHIERFGIALQSAGDLAGSLAPSAGAAVAANAAGYTALVLGCGLGNNKAIRRFVDQLMRHSLPATVIDADGLNCMAVLQGWASRLPAQCVLTPHPAEMARLCQLEVSEVVAQRWSLARQKAAQWGCVVLLKGPYTVVAHPDGFLGVLPIATPALATAGSGDVLAGTIGGLLAQGLEPLAAACVGAWLHGTAGLLCEQEIGPAGVLASDLLARLPLVLRELHGGKQTTPIAATPAKMKLS